MKFFDLFAGIGGFRVGMEKNGHECVGSCEIDKYARQIYAKNFGHEPEYTDVRKINPESLKDFDCLCAGFPCQAFSLAGQRRGFEDTRGTLFFEIARIAREKRPSLLFLENVKGLLSHDKGETFRVILETLDELGYWYEWRVVNSKNYGLAQNRERVFIIGHLRGQSTREVLSFGEDGKGNDTSRRTLHPKDECSSTLTSTYWKGYGGGRPMIAESKAKHINMTKHNGSRVYSKDGVSPSVMAGEGSGTRIKIAEQKPDVTVIGSTQKNAATMKNMSPTLTEAAGKGGGHVPMIVEPKIKRVDGKPNVYNTDAQAGKVYDVDGISPSVTGQRINSQGFVAEPKIKMLKKSNDDSYRIYSTDGVSRTLRASPGGMGKMTGVYGEKKTTMIMNANKNSNCKNRIQERDESWALTGNSNDFSIWDNYRIRRLTPTECERLQGFNDGWTIGCSDTQRYKMLGNAVSVNVVEYIGGFL